MNKIPVIGAPIVNNPYWLHRLIMSVDYPVENFVIINNNGRGQIDKELDTIAQMSHDFIDNIKVVHMPANIGCAGAWNLIIKCYMNASYWMIVNDDIAFKPGCLKQVAKIYADNPDMGMVHPNAGEWGIGTWDCFAISEKVVRLFGLFDENTYPAYCEDADYIMRMAHRPIQKVVNLDSQFIRGHGEPNEYYEDNGGGRTGQSDKALGDILRKSNDVNIEYLTEKWGKGWRQINPSKLPWENQPHHIGEVRWDLDYVRSKYTGF